MWKKNSQYIPCNCTYLRWLELSNLSHHKCPHKRCPLNEMRLGFMHSIILDENHSLCEKTMFIHQTNLDRIEQAGFEDTNQEKDKDSKTLTPIWIALQFLISYGEWAVKDNLARKQRVASLQGPDKWFDIRKFREQASPEWKSQTTTHQAAILLWPKQNTSRSIRCPQLSDRNPGTWMRTHIL